MYLLMVFAFVCIIGGMFLGKGKIVFLGFVLGAIFTISFTGTSSQMKASGSHTEFHKNGDMTITDKDGSTITIPRTTGSQQQ